MVVQYHNGLFPPNGQVDWQKLIPLLGPTAAAVALYDGALARIPKAQVLLSPLTRQEAVLSSRIEGTRATIEEVLEFEAGGRQPNSDERRKDIHEILNYRRAMHKAGELMRTLPICERVILDTHKILMDGVRGKGKSPGHYRRISNWIGPPGCSMDEARFVPIEANKLPHAMSVWEKYMHREHDDRLVQLAILHAEFEALHPFLDGNGRMGRMLIPLIMWQYGLINAPFFYLSDFFEAHRDQYYEKLLAVSRDRDWTGWVAFFLKALQAQAEDNLQKVHEIRDLYESMKSQFVKTTHSQHAVHALDWIFETPIFSVTQFREKAGVPKTSVNRILTALRQKGLLQVVVPSSGRRAAILIFPALLNITEGRQVF